MLQYKFCPPPTPNFYTFYDVSTCIIKCSPLIFKHLLRGCMHIAHSCIPATAKYRGNHCFSFVYIYCSHILSILFSTPSNYTNFKTISE